MTDVSNLFDPGEPGGAADAGVVLHVHVSPGAGRSAVVGRHGDALKLRVAAPPVDGRANEAAAKLLAETFELKPAEVELVAGDTSRTKRFRLGGLDAEEAQRRLRLLLEPESRPRAH